MTIIFDLDYTLLDTVKLKRQLAQAMNLKYNEFDEGMLKYFSEMDYNFDTHLKILAQEGKIKSLIKIEKCVNEIFKNLDSCLFPQVLNILAKLKKRGHKLILLTRGDVNWQKRKVCALSARKYFAKIIFTGRSKHLLAKKEFKNEPDIIIVNDNARESLEMKRELGRGKIILIKGPYANNVKHKLKSIMIKNLLSHIFTPLEI